MSQGRCPEHAILGQIAATPPAATTAMSHHFARPSSAPTQDISATVSGPPNSFLFSDLVVPSPQMLPGDMSSPFIGLSSRLMARGRPWVGSRQGGRSPSTTHTHIRQQGT